MRGVYHDNEYEDKKMKLAGSNEGAENEEGAKCFQPLHMCENLAFCDFGLYMVVYDCSRARTAGLSLVFPRSFLGA